MEKNHCQACTNEKYGVKTRNSVAHVCEKSDPKYVPPTTRELIEKNQVLVHITSCIFDTGKATKWKLKNNQWVNGYKVKASNNEVWVPNSFHIFNGATVEKGIWIDKDFYDKMAFV